jgi:hypothetical protein
VQESPHEALHLLDLHPDDLWSGALRLAHQRRQVLRSLLAPRDRGQDRADGRLQFKNIYASVTIQQ